MPEEPKGRGDRVGRRLVPKKEAMYRLSIGRQKWHELVQAHRIPATRVGGRVVIRSDLLDALIDDPDCLSAPIERAPKRRR